MTNEEDTRGFISYILKQFINKNNVNIKHCKHAVIALMKHTFQIIFM